jgi:two-component system, OmpR family, sensor histidine kinase CpxA
MNSLFLKIFIWFWLTVILVGVVEEFALMHARKPGGVHAEAFATQLPDAAMEAVHSWELAGESGLANFILHEQHTYSVQAFFFQDGGADLLHRRAPAAVQKMEDLVFREPGFHIASTGEVAGARALGTRGSLYALVFVLPHGLLPASWVSLPYFRIVPILLASSLFCYFIAGHVTNPLMRLRAATTGIAEGRLDTRVSPELRRRHDEIANLALDFDRMAARIEALVHGQKQLLANVSHELRSPLARLLVALSLAKQAPAEEAAEHLDRIGLEARRLDKLIGQLLALSRIDSTVDAGPRSPVDLTALVQDVASDGDFEARAHSRRVSVTAAADCVAEGYEEALRSALENVVRNAVRYTREGTEVEVSLQRAAAAATVCVRDHGPGVPEDMLAGIFQPFRRVPGDSAAEGSGLGLAITERAIRAHSGTVRALNAEGGGLVVELNLPLNKTCAT